MVYYLKMKINNGLILKNCNIFLTYESRPESNTRFEITTIQMHFEKIDRNKAR